MFQAGDIYPKYPASNSCNSNKPLLLIAIGSIVRIGMAVIKIRIEKAKLLKAVGLSYRNALHSLIEQKFIKSFTDIIEISVDKDKALHLQALLEFHDVQKIPSIPTKPYKNED